MKKKIISAVLLIFMLAALFPVNVSAEYWGDICFGVYVTSPEKGGTVDVGFSYKDGHAVKDWTEGTCSYTYQWLIGDDVVAENKSCNIGNLGERYTLKVKITSCQVGTFNVHLGKVIIPGATLYSDHKGENFSKYIGVSSGHMNRDREKRTVEFSYTFDPVCYPVTNADIGVAAPAVGEKASFEPKANGNFTITDVKWYDGTEGGYLGTASRFVEGHKYTVDFKIRPCDYYYFPQEGSVITVNGNPVDSSDIYKTDITDDGGFNYSCYYTFPKLSVPVNPFSDVKESDYFYDPVIWALYHDPQITKGTDEKHFSPGATCDRGQVVTFLWRASGEPEPKTSVNPFTDVKETDYFYKAVLWAVEKGITNGVSKTQFGPKKPCDRGQVVTFLWRAKGEPEPDSGENPFTDVKETDYFCKAVLWAVGKNVTKGTGATKFSPKNSCTRGQVVTFLYRADKIPVTIKYPKVTAEADRSVIREDAGDKAVLTAKAEDGRPPYSYQWKKWVNGWVDIPGATGTSYTATAAGKYDCWVEDSVGTTGMSNSVTIYGFETPESNGVNELDDGFLFYIENSVEIKGRGVVATGTVLNGSVRTYDSLTLMTWDDATATPAELPLTVAGIEKNHAAQETAGKGDAVGLLFQGVSIEDLRPGSALVGAGSGLIASEGPFYGTLSLKSEADGGTHEPVYVDNMFDLEYAGHAVMGEIQGLGGADEMNPGDTREDVCFGGFDHPVVWYVGQVLTVKEGGRVIGTFTVTRVS